MDIDAETRDAIANQLARLSSIHGAGALTRVERALEAALGLREPPEMVPLHRPTDFYVPGLTARPWYAPSEYSVTQRLASRLEAEFRTITAEYDHLSARDPASHRPYNTRGQSLEKFGLQGIPEAWLALSLREDGAWFDEICAACPVTHRIAREFEDALLETGDVFFSVLTPHTALAPHYDATNALLTLMLPLRVPPGCGLQVGGVTRELVPGTCVLFDDTFLHHAWNDSDQPRVVLILDIWHPELTPSEVDACRVVERLLAETLPPRHED